ncbi:MAG: XDD4 family exosortase-dependent surface protein [Planctomycetaceae bacterium]
MSMRVFLRSLVPTVCLSVFVVLMLLLLPGAVRAGTITTVTGSLSGTYPVSAEATFVTSGSSFTLTLRNTSPTPTTLFPAQVLTGFFFDMPISGTVPLSLTYVSGSGSVAKLIGGGTAAENWLYDPPPPAGTGPSFSGPLRGPMMSNIRTFTTDVDTWHFRSDLNTAAAPGTKFGISTVGNGSYTSGSNNFPQTYVGQINFGIFNGNASDPRGLLKNLIPDAYLVSGSAVFTFQANVDLENYQFVDPYVFTFGTSPDQSITLLPEPAGWAMAGGAALVGWAARRRRRDARARPTA